MLVLFPPLKALLEADRGGWTPQPPTSAQAVWAHAQGLRLLAQKIPHRADVWRLQMVLGADVLDISLPRTRGPAPMHLKAILRDIAVWIQALDLAPRQRIAHQVAAWLVYHGHTGPYRLKLRGSTEGLRGEIYVPGQATSALPPRLLDLLRPDLDVLWTRTPPHGAQARHNDAEGNTHSVQWRREYPVPTEYRVMDIELPSTAHDRLRLMGEAPLGWREIPFPS